jgi:uncharacterized protein
MVIPAGIKNPNAARYYLYEKTSGPPDSLTSGLFKMPDFVWYQWIIAAMSAVAIGVAKTGVPGFGIVVVPIFALLVNDAVGSAGWLLPLLCFADVFAVVYHRRHAQIPKLLELVPWVMVGMALGASAMYADRQWLQGAGWKPVSNAIIGGILLAMVGMHVWRKRRSAPPPSGSTWQAAGFGVGAGFTTVLANAAGPIMNLYFLAKRFPKEQLIGTGAWFFLIVNLSKVPFYAPLGLFTRQSLLFDLVLIPGVIVGALTGRAIFQRLSQRVFEVVVLSLAALAAVALIVPRSWWVPSSPLALSSESAQPFSQAPPDATPADADQGPDQAVVPSDTGSP